MLARSLAPRNDRINPSSPLATHGQRRMDKEHTGVFFRRNYAFFLSSTNSILCNLVQGVGFIGAPARTNDATAAPMTRTHAYSRTH